MGIPNFDSQLKELLDFKIGEGSVLSAKKIGEQVVFEKVDYGGRIWRRLQAFFGADEGLNEIRAQNLAIKIKEFVETNKDKISNLDNDQLIELNKKIINLKDKYLIGKEKLIGTEMREADITQRIFEAASGIICNFIEESCLKAASDSHEIEVKEPKPKEQVLNEQIKRGEEAISPSKMASDILFDTTGRGKVTLSEAKTKINKKSAYDVFIDDKKLIQHSKRDLYFVGSNKISLKLEGKFIKLTEVDEKDTTIFYVDPTEYVDPMGKVKGAYMAYTYPPREISKEEATVQVQNIKTNFRVEVEIAIYNRHGVVVCGKWKDTGRDILFWVSPEGKTELIPGERTRTAGGFIGGSTNVNFITALAHAHPSKLNGEKADLLILKK